ncbi:MAG: ATP-binding protein, partial [Candidatus Margulisbacteria bacterium]|nr:ATP-binding protein [Candidatus Margulisiibacteriota bacterium]
VREVYHEAGIRYRDWTAAVVILWALAIMFRFVALGTHSFEGYILAGFGMATIMVMRFFAFRGR